MKNSLIIQSGGPTSVINSTLYGVIKELKAKNKEGIIYGSKNGVIGIIKNNLINLSEVSDENIELLKQTNGAILGSSRHKLSDDFTNSDFTNILNNIRINEIHYIFVIGGNDSMDTCDKLNQYFIINKIDCKVLGLPKTIDNDLIVTDHTPGYGSALKYIASTITTIKQDIKCYEKGKVTIVEIMGRDTGWLTAGSLLAKLSDNAPDLIYLPEGKFDLTKFYNDVKSIYEKQKYCLVCISEGVEVIDTSDAKVDAFGHKQLGGLAATLEKMVEENLNLPTRSIELNIMQRCSSFINSKTDILEAIRCGRHAVRYMLKGKSGKMVYMKRVSEYKIKYLLTELHPIANSIKYFPTNWILNDNYISDEFLTYALPLIQGEEKVTYENGIIKLAKI